MSECQTFNLVCDAVNGDFAIYQGASYNCTTFYFVDRDLTAYTPLGQIKDNYAEDGGGILATFSFEPLVFGSVTVGDDTFNATVIRPILAASETALIPAALPKSATAPFLAGINSWVYDIKLVDPAETLIVVRGFVEVIKDVSR